jgi:hypothetical protein
MRCQLCDEKEFDVIYNVDKPIDLQPVIICFDCSREYLTYKACLRIWVNQENVLQKGNRCVTGFSGHDS